MRVKNYEQRTVAQIAQDMPAGNSVLYAEKIQPTTRYTLANIAAATSVTTDELMARMEYRVRQEARRVQPAPAPVVKITPVVVEAPYAARAMKAVA